MRQFFNGSPSAFEDLELRAQRACIVFNEEMPPTAIPRYARVGFEATSPDGTALLLVQKNVQYSGESEEVRSWFLSGEKRFANFMTLRCWLLEQLMPEYGRGAEESVPEKGQREEEPPTDGQENPPEGPEGACARRGETPMTTVAPPKRAPSEEEKRINKEANEQALTIEELGEKAKFAASVIAEIHEEASHAFSEVVYLKEREKRALARLDAKLGTLSRRLLQIAKDSSGQIASLLDSQPSPEETQEKIRQIGQEALQEIKQTARSYIKKEEESS